MTTFKEPYKILRVETNKSSLPQPPSVEKKILPSVCSSYLVVGRSGSGKTICVANMLRNPNLLGSYFDFIFWFSPVKSDDIVDAIGLPPENIINEFTEDDVNKILDAMEKKIEKEGMDKVGKESKIAMVFDDILSMPKFLRSNAIAKLTTAGRHFCVSAFFLSQYYRSIPPIIRQNVSGLIFFPSSLLEIEKLADEQTQPNQSKKQFIDIVRRATDEKHSFLFLNAKAEQGKRLRKNFDTILYDDGTEEKLL